MQLNYVFIFFHKSNVLYSSLRLTSQERDSARREAMSKLIHFCFSPEIGAETGGSAVLILSWAPGGGSPKEGYRLIEIVRSMENKQG